MIITRLDYAALFFATFGLVALFTPLMRKIALRKNVMDAPTSEHKTHQEPIPYLGGVGIILGIVIISLLALFYQGMTSKIFWLEASVLGPALILGAIGLWDDLKNLSPLPRFIAQTLAGIFTSVVLIASNTVGTPTGSKIVDGIITTIWIVGICNSINFFDNLDGGAAGTVAVSATALAILAHHESQFLISGLAIVTSGAMIGFLIYNKAPARIYMGDAGALFLGLLIATLTIRFHPTTLSQSISFATKVLLLAVPILDTSVAVLSRIRRGVSPFQGGKDHLSHRLIRLGIERKYAALSLWALSAGFALCAIIISRVGKSAQEAISVVAAAAWLLLFAFFFSKQDA